jgi:hypothetical protein
MTDLPQSPEPGNAEVLTSVDETPSAKLRREFNEALTEVKQRYVDKALVDLALLHALLANDGDDDDDDGNDDDDEKAATAEELAHEIADIHADLAEVRARMRV